MIRTNTATNQGKSCSWVISFRLYKKWRRPSWGFSLPIAVTLINLELKYKSQNWNKTGNSYQCVFRQRTGYLSRSTVPVSCTLSRDNVSFAAKSLFASLTKFESSLLLPWGFIKDRAYAPIPILADSSRTEKSNSRHSCRRFDRRKSKWKIQYDRR